MNSPVRVVCDECLRSVELTRGPTRGRRSLCPNCGGRDRRPTRGIRGTEPERPETAGRGAEPGPSGSPEMVERATGSRPGPGARWGRSGGFSSASVWAMVGLAKSSGRTIPGSIATWRSRCSSSEPGERVMERFFREARAVAAWTTRTSWPSTTPALTTVDAGSPTSSWVAGPLWWYRDHHRMDAATVARIIRGLADALDHPIAWESCTATSSRQRAHRRPRAPAADRLRPGPPVRLRVRPDSRGASSGRRPT